MIGAVAGPLAIAVSGGGDSIALLALARRAAPDRAVAALIVDHALRAGSDLAAEQAGAIARSLGAVVRILRLDWAGAPPSGQAGARVARYRALAEALRDLGGEALFVGHTRDDHIETARLRASSASGHYGEAGMTEASPFPLWPEGRGLALMRPLLGVRRADLRAWLAREEIAYLDDPANADARFARVRVRAALRGEDEAALAAELAAIAERAGWAAEIDALASAALAEIQISLDGELAIPAASIESLPPAARRRAFSALVAAGSGDCGPPSGAGLDRLAAGGWFSATLGGAAFRRAGDVLHVRRDPGAALGRGHRFGPRRMALDGPLIFDRRIALTPLIEGLGLEIRPSARSGVRAHVIRPHVAEKEAEITLTDAQEAGVVVATPLAGEILRRVLWRTFLWRSDRAPPVHMAHRGAITGS
jgi:tRNA(Ile)-lysidine synthase